MRTVNPVFAFFVAAGAVLAACLAALSLSGAPPPPKVVRTRGRPDESSRIKAALTAYFGDQVELTNVELHAVPGFENLYAANCEWEKDWWGQMMVFEFREGRLTWVAGTEGGHIPDTQSLLRLRPLRLPQCPHALFEVYSTTHMGHGNYLLVELRGHTLCRLIDTFAVDHHDDQHLIRGGAMNAAYRDLNGDGALDVELTGTIDLKVDAQGRERIPVQDGYIDACDLEDWHIKSIPARKVFLWDDARLGFVESRKLRTGFDEVYPDRD